MQAVILAAGRGKRLGLGIPKILVEVSPKITLLEHHLKGLAQIGVNEIIIVGGYKCKLIDQIIQKKKLNKQYKLSLIKARWKKKGNAYSLFQAKDLIKDKFLLLMGDLFLDYSSLKKLLKKEPITIVIDRQPPRNLSTKAATKVKLKGNKVLWIQKGQLSKYDAIEFGVALVDKRVFRYKIEPTSDWIDLLGNILQRESIKVFDIKGAFWKNINYKKDLEEVRRYFQKNENIA